MAEGMPQESPSPVERPLVALTRLVLRYPLATLLIGAALALAAALLSQFRLGFRTNRLDLLNPKSEFNKLWLDYIREFGDREDVVVVVQGANREDVLQVRNDLAEDIAHDKRQFDQVLWTVDRSALAGKGLYYLPVEQLRQIDGLLDRAEPIVKGNWAYLNLGTMGYAACQQLAESTDPAAQAVALEGMSRFAEGLLAALDGHYQSPWGDMAGQAPAGPTDAEQFLADDGRMGLIVLKLAQADEGGDFVRGAKAIAALRKTLASWQAQHREMTIGLTGLPVIEHDEMRSSESSMTEVSFVSLIGVSLLFVAGFGGWRHPLLAVLSLSLGTVWAMGYITLAIGHLNILSSAFAVILIGQGIDFSMYYVAEYLELRKTEKQSGPALVATVRKVGPGIATGAITTAVAFFMAGLTEFTGVAELGIIAGGGILLCWLAGMTVLPAALHLADSRWPTRHVPVPVDVQSWLAPVFARPGLVLGATAALTLFLAAGLPQTSYDYNLMHLQARGLESVELEQKLLSQADHNASFALSLAKDRQELLANKAKFLALPRVQRVEEIASNLPDDVERKRPLIERIHARLTALQAALPREGVPMIPATAAADLVRILDYAKKFAPRGAEGDRFLQLAERTIESLRRLPPAECQPRLAEQQQRTAGELVGRLQGLAAVSNPAPPELADLPAPLVARFLSPSGRHLMKVYCRGDVWDIGQMKEFIDQVRGVDPRITGNPLQIYEASQQMRRSYEQAALYAFLIIVPVVFLDFRSVRSTLLALLPLGLGMTQMFGLMGLLGIPLNPANMIVLPLILGIGIDAGVHVVHDFLSQKGRYRINPSTASAVVINSVTNMAGFGSLMIASHRGLQSLGRVITLGLTCCLFSSLVILPAMFALISRRREVEETVEEPEPAAKSEESPIADDGPAQALPVSRPNPRVYRRSA